MKLTTYYDIIPVDPGSDTENLNYFGILSDSNDELEDEPLANKDERKIEHAVIHTALKTIN